MERGGGGIYTKEEVDAYKMDVKNILIHLGLLDGVETHTIKQQELTEVVYVNAEYDAYWYPQVVPGVIWLKKDSVLVC